MFKVNGVDSGKLYSLWGEKGSQILGLFYENLTRCLCPSHVLQFCDMMNMQTATPACMHLDSSSKGARREGM